jgi:short subunit dehydrogenase-like uncharacterized protein
VQAIVGRSGHRTQTVRDQVDSFFEYWELFSPVKQLVSQKLTSYKLVVTLAQPEHPKEASEPC